VAFHEGGTWGKPPMAIIPTLGISLRMLRSCARNDSVTMPRNPVRAVVGDHLGKRGEEEMKHGPR